MKPCEISIVMAVYNGEKYLRDTLDSIVSQSFDSFELIVIDDASTDSTPEILKDYAECDARIKVFRNPENLRLARSLNRGIGLAEGKYIVRMKYTFENGIGEIYARAYAVRLDIGTIAVTVGDCEMVRLDVRSGLDVACGEADTRPDQGFQTLLVPDRTADVRVRVQSRGGGRAPRVRPCRPPRRAQFHRFCVPHDNAPLGCEILAFDRSERSHRGQPRVADAVRFHLSRGQL